MSEQEHGPRRHWASLFPGGRTIYYEGGDPDGFAEQIKREFGFDPRECPGHDMFTDEPKADTWTVGRGFHCPAGHLDAIYGSGRWPLGS